LRSQAWDEEGFISFSIDQLPPALQQQVLKVLDGLVPDALLRRTYRLPNAAGPLLQAVATQLTHPGVSLAGHLAGVLGAATLMAGPAALAASAPVHAGLWLLGHVAVSLPPSPSAAAAARPPPRWGSASARLARLAARAARRVGTAAVTAGVKGLERVGIWIKRPSGAGGDGSAGWVPAVGDRVVVTGLQRREDLNGQVAARRRALLALLGLYF
jgi:hypothetical protein